MKRWLFSFVVIVAGVAAQAQPAVPQIAFDSIPDPVKLPKDMYLGEASGVAVNSKGHVFVFSRGNTTGPAYAASAAQLLEFDADGNFIREIGKNLYALVVRACRAGRQGRQHLGHRQGLGPRRQVQPRRQGADDPRPQARGVG